MKYQLSKWITARFKLNYGDFELSVNLRLPNSGITVLFGHSGSGKTTLLRCIAGLEQAQHGYLEINGSVWQDSVVGVFCPHINARLVMCFKNRIYFHI